MSDALNLAEAQNKLEYTRESEDTLQKLQMNLNDKLEQLTLPAIDQCMEAATREIANKKQELIYKSAEETDTSSDRMKEEKANPLSSQHDEL